MPRTALEFLLVSEPVHLSGIQTIHAISHAQASCSWPFFQCSAHHRSWSLGKSQIQ
ncbi:MAG: hypothetical protein CM1200mP18_08030 [Gammaproteobacteria bacterium]|nr:MAG: hypothetical protein CM1200mP18_08030 [Gammaproteobacteria bacterium]